MPAERPPTGRIIIMTGEFAPQRGGIATSAGELAAALAAHGREVEVWAAGSPPPSGEIRRGFTVRRLPVPANQDLGTRRTLARWLEAHRVDWEGACVCLFEPLPVRAMAALGARHGIPPNLFAWVHGSEVRRWRRSLIERRRIGRLLSGIRLTACFSRFVQNELRRAFPAACRHSAVIPPGARPEWLASPPPAAGSACRGGGFDVLSVGRVDPRKGHDVLVRAAALLPDPLRSRITLRIAGPIRRPAWKRRVDRIARRGGVRLLWEGDVSDARLAALHGGADLFAFPSIKHGAGVEGFGLACLDAAACGLPVLASRTGGIPEAVVDGVTGLLLPPGDAGAWSAALARLHGDAALRTTLGRNGRRHAAGFTWEHAALHLLSAIDS